MKRRDNLVPCRAKFSFSFSGPKFTEYTDLKPEKVTGYVTEDQYRLIEVVQKLVSKNSHSKDKTARKLLMKSGMLSVQAKNFIKAERKYQQLEKEGLI